MLRESQAFAGQVLWFSTLVSKGGNLADIHKQLNKLGASAVRTIHMAQGNKQSRFVAWTFLEQSARQAWRAQRWQVD
jgi:23S rRNA (adenine1618-N6)-methyltransferase